MTRRQDEPRKQNRNIGTEALKLIVYWDQLGDGEWCVGKVLRAGHVQRLKEGFTRSRAVAWALKYADQEGHPWPVIEITGKKPA